MTTVAVALAIACAAAGSTAPAGAVASSTPAAPASRVVNAAMARFEVLSPTLVRAEYSPAQTFEDRPTETAMGRAAMLATPPPPYTVADNGVTLTIATAALTLQYVKGAPLASGLTLTLDVGGTATTAVPQWNACQQSPAGCGPTGGLPNPPTSSDIGGYQREIVSTTVNGADHFYPLTAGMLTTKGYYLLDDTATAIRTDEGSGLPTVAARAGDTGYMDGYIFGYGQDYARGLADLNALTGPTPLLPEWAFGPWFSDYINYGAADFENTIVPAFRAHATPLDGLVLDTSWKAPDSWNGYDWNLTNFPDPAAFTSWASAQGLHTVLNIHPSIDETDPHYAATKATAGSLASPPGGCAFYRMSPPCDVFDWSVPAQATAYFNLHAPLLNSGVSAFWLDWCCEASGVSAVAGVTPDSLVADQYAQQLTARGGRGFVLSRVGSGIYNENAETGDAVAPATGAWAAHRSSIGFTGDGSSDFATLAYEAALTPAEGAAIGLAYLSHDIGGYTVAHLADDLYARWMQMGTFSPIDRLHGKNSDRLPWEYADGSGADVSAERFLRLREALVPYTYTAAWEAHTSGLPLSRAMAIAYPGSAAALAATDQWMYGDNLLVAPITSAGATATRSVWIPPGSWTDFFTGDTVIGPATITTPSEGFDRAPVYVRAGGPIILAPPMDHVGQRAQTPLTVRVAPGAAGSASLYSDAGDGQGYLAGQTATTQLSYSEPSAGGGVVSVDPQQGSFPGAPSARAYAVQFLSTARPHNVTVQGTPVPETADSTGLDMTATASAVPSADSWSYDPPTRTVTVLVAARSTAGPVVVAHDVQPGAVVAEVPLLPVFLLIPGAAAITVATARRRRRR